MKLFCNNFWGQTEETMFVINGIELTYTHSVCQSALKEINPEYSLEELLLKLKLQYFGHLRRRANLLEKTLILGKTEGKRRRG